jgi:hypothetical protein
VQPGLLIRALAGSRPLALLTNNVPVAFLRNQAFTRLQAHDCHFFFLEYNYSSGTSRTQNTGGALMKPVAHIILLSVAALMTPAPFLAQQQAAQPEASVTGTGKARYVPIWTSTTALADSPIYVAAGDVGIGTTTPTATLDVNGNALVTGSLTLGGNILLPGSGGPIIFAPNTGSNNFSAGLGALPTATTGTENTAVGDTALHGNTSGSNNTALGTGALFANTTGPGNTAVGESALAANTTGENNVAIGNDALQSNTTSSGNTAVGGGAMQNTTGTADVAIGTGALNNAGGGSNNVAIGWGAGGPGGGNWSISIGTSAASNVNGNIGNILIGTNGASGDGNTIRIGGGTSGISDAMTQKAFFVSGVRGVATGNNNAVPVVIDSNGQLGTVSSSRRFKEDIHDMAQASDGLMQLRPVTFRYQKAYEDGSKPIQYGLIAEEVADVYPDLVARTADGQVESVKYQLLDPMLLNEVQKQHATIASQEQQIASQQEQIRVLENRLARVEAALTGSAAATTSLP